MVVGIMAFLARLGSHCGKYHVAFNICLSCISDINDSFIFFEFLSISRLFFYVQGEFPYPDPSKWTDEELGVPPDDYAEPAIRTI